LEKNIRGRIVKIESKDYYVKEADDQIIRCSLRGKFKKTLQLKKDKLTTLDVASIGDWVNYSFSTKGIGVIESVEERKNYLSRKAGKARGSLRRGGRLEQVIASNIDNLFIVTSIKSPKFNNGFIDRVIVSAESCGINVNLVINKIDLDDMNLSEEWEQLYTNIGYKVFVISAMENIGIEEIKSLLQNKVNIFWGQSGVGKSTLLNTMFSHLDFEVGEISESSNKGTHTTVTGEMREVGQNTYIIDTPGIKEIDPYGIKEEDVCHYYKEFLPFIPDCKFNTCIHKHEPGCAVVAAVEDEQITYERYESYLSLLETIEDDMIY
jgi:ribosome biogenesis GTPase / thiamine phosphate phosphatase